MGKKEINELFLTYLKTNDEQYFNIFYHNFKILTKINFLKTGNSLKDFNQFEDVYHTTILRLLKNTSEFRNGNRKNVLAYSLTIFANIIKDLNKKASNDREEYLHDASRQGYSIEETNKAQGITIYNTFIKK